MIQERLQKILARAGVASRRAAEVLIVQGQVKVNGQVVNQLGTRVDPQNDCIEVSGKKILFSEKRSKLYYAYYKPVGLVVTKHDELGRKGIFAELNLPAAVNAVGRLDKDSEGLLLLSNDGEFIHRYTHPSFQISKIYRVLISRPLTYEERQTLRAGILSEGKKLKAFSIKKIKISSHPPLSRIPQHWIEIELREGLKREIRRMMAHFDIRVLRLIRVQHGEFKIENLKPGELRQLPFTTESDKG